MVPRLHESPEDQDHFQHTTQTPSQWLVRADQQEVHPDNEDSHGTTKVTQLAEADPLLHLCDEQPIHTVNRIHTVRLILWTTVLATGRDLRFRCEAKCRGMVVRTNEHAGHRKKEDPTPQRTTLEESQPRTHGGHLPRRRLCPNPQTLICAMDTHQARKSVVWTIPDNQGKAPKLGDQGVTQSRRHHRCSLFFRQTFPRAI